MSGVVPAIPRLKFTNATGVPIASGSVTVYLAGTTTLANTYQDKALSTLNDNPVPLDGNGEALFWLDPSLTYKFLLKDSLGATITGWPVDNILGGGNSPTLQQSYVDTFSGTGSQTVFTLSATPGSIKDTNVYIGGVYQKKSAYTLAGGTLTFVAAPASGTNNIEVTYYVLLDFTGLAATISGYSNAASASATAAATSRSQMLYIVQGNFAPGTPPVVRDDGSAIQNGDYASFTDNLFRRYNGATWVASDVNTANLAASTGASLIGYGATTVKAQLDVMPTLAGPNTFQDTAGTTGSQIDITHFGDGSGGTGNQTYGINIRNRVGARSATVIHQYSNISPAVWIDNTDNQAALYIHNTHNSTLNPTGPATSQGDYLRLAVEGVDKLRLDYRFFFLAATGVTPTFVASGVGDVALAVTQNAAAIALSISQSGAGTALNISHTGASSALVINANNSGAANFFPAVFNGYNYGPSVTTSADSGVSLTVSKNGTGAGVLAQFVNKGTGLSLDIRSASLSLFAITAAGLPQWVAFGNQQTTVGAAGAASALPATPTKYFKVVDSAGTTLVIPAYAAA